MRSWKGRDSLLRRVAGRSFREVIVASTRTDRRDRRWPKHEPTGRSQKSREPSRTFSVMQKRIENEPYAISPPTKCEENHRRARDSFNYPRFSIVVYDEKKASVALFGPRKVSSKRFARAGCGFLRQAIFEILISKAPEIFACAISASREVRLSLPVGRYKTRQDRAEFAARITAKISCRYQMRRQWQDSANGWIIALLAGFSRECRLEQTKGLFPGLFDRRLLDLCVEQLVLGNQGSAWQENSRPEYRRPETRSLANDYNTVFRRRSSIGGVAEGRSPRLTNRRWCVVRRHHLIGCIPVYCPRTCSPRFSTGLRIISAIQKLLRAPIRSVLYALAP